jgi:hypothetical protein
MIGTNHERLWVTLTNYGVSLDASPQIRNCVKDKAKASTSLTLSQVSRFHRCSCRLSAAVSTIWPPPLRLRFSMPSAEPRSRNWEVGGEAMLVHDLGAHGRRLPWAPNRQSPYPPVD